jgi:hypothetical protein
MSGPHDFAVRFDTARQRRRCVHRIPRPTFVTIAKRPSCGCGTRRLEPLICPTEQAEYFSAKDWTTQITLSSFKNFRFPRSRFFGRQADDKRPARPDKRKRDHWPEQWGANLNRGAFDRKQRISGNCGRSVRAPNRTSYDSMPRRNFTRVFCEETGITPADFVETARVDAGGCSRTPTSRCSASPRAAASPSPTRCGGAFLRRIGTGPSEYRERLRG